MDTGIVDDESQFFRGQAKIERYKDCAQGMGGKECFQQRRMIKTQVTHPVSNAYALRAQQGCLTSYAVTEFAIGVLLLFKKKGGALRI